MEHHTIELGKLSWLEIEYEADGGVAGSYDEAPSIAFISIQSCKLCQHDEKGTHKVEMYGIDEAFVMVDFEAIEEIILEELRG